MRFSILILLFGVWINTDAQPIKMFFLDGNLGNVYTHKKKETNFFIAFPFKNRFNAQLSFSPFKNISISASYFRQRTVSFSEVGILSLDREETKRSYNLALGTYYFFEMPKKKNSNKWKKLQPYLRQRRGLLGNFQIGISNNEVNNNYFTLNSNILDRSANIEYRSIYAQIGVYYLLETQVFSFSNTYAWVKYDRIGIIGGFNNLNSIENILSSYAANPTRKFFTTNLQHQIGLKKFRINYGFNLNYNFISEIRQVSFEQFSLYSGIIVNL